MSGFFVFFDMPFVHHREVFGRCIDKSTFNIVSCDRFNSGIAKFSNKTNKIYNILFFRRENKRHNRMISDDCAANSVHFVINIMHLTIIFFRFLYKHVIKICHTPYNAHVKSYVYLISHLHLLKKIKDTKKLTSYKLVGRKYYNNIIIILHNLKNRIKLER